MCLLPRGAIVAFVASSQRAEKEEEEMNHYMYFDPYVIKERNQQVYREVHSLRLEQRLREERGSSGSRFVALAKRAVRPLLREVHRAG
jgi:tRNA A-37 threonylcarbamoyl transferase component Bud32